MTPLSSMSKEEILDIISISRGTTVFYIEHIEDVSSVGFGYQGTYHKFANGEVYQHFLDKIETYNVYKFLATKESLESLIDESLENTVVQQYISKLQLLADTYTAHMDHWTNAAKSQVSTLERLVSDISHSHSVIVSNADRLSDLVDEVLPNKTKKAINNLVADLTSIKASYAESISKAQSEFYEVINSLKTLFK